MTDKRKLPAKEALFRKVCVTASQSARLGIFQLECAHRQVQSLTDASRHLGRAKAFVLVAAGSVLNSVQQHYKRHLLSLGLTIRLVGLRLLLVGTPLS